jgi:hypothetical protein
MSLQDVLEENAVTRVMFIVIGYYRKEIRFILLLKRKEIILLKTGKEI